MPNKAKKRIELLAPAGSLEKLKYALHYGADAVYVGIPDFSLRYRVNDFDEKSLIEAVEYVHKKKKKIFVTANIYAHNVHIKKFERHLSFLGKLGIDGMIVSDPGILEMVKKALPKVDIHLSTQANATNWQAVKFWKAQGVKRVILAREVTLEEIREIKRKVPGVELEYFVHGAMCMSYSGRCILSKWMTGRSANLGDCAQPCRWKYKQKSCVSNIELQSGKRDAKTMTVEDDKKEFEIDLEEDENGTYFFNSKDLNLLNYLGELKKVGIDSFKIEGRNKSVYYLAVVIRAYREVIDAMEKRLPSKEIKKIKKRQQKELDDLVNRGYTEGFLLGNEPEHNFSATHNESRYQFVGQVEEAESGMLKVKVHNAIRLGDELEIVSIKGNKKIKVKEIFNDKNQSVESAHGGQGKRYYFKIGKMEIEPMALLRKVVVDNL